MAIFFNDIRWPYIVVSRPNLEGITWSCWCDTRWQIARSLRTVHVDLVAGMASQSTTSFLTWRCYGKLDVVKEIPLLTSELFLHDHAAESRRCERILRRTQNMILVSFEIYFVAIWNIFVMIISNFSSTRIS